MDWDFGVVDILTWTCLSATNVPGLDDLEASPSPFDADQPSPWIELGLNVTTVEGPRLSMHVQRLDVFLRRREDATNPEARSYELLSGIAEVADLYVTLGDDPSVLVDAICFDWPLVDRLLFNSPEIRRRVLWPCLTDAENSILTRLEADYSIDDAVRHAMAALQETFGLRLRLDADDALTAARVLRDRAFIGELADLLHAHPHLFTPEGLERLLECWADDDPT